MVKLEGLHGHGGGIDGIYGKKRNKKEFVQNTDGNQLFMAVLVVTVWCEYLFTPVTCLIIINIYKKSLLVMHTDEAQGFVGLLDGLITEFSLGRTGDLESSVLNLGFDLHLFIEQK